MAESFPCRKSIEARDAMNETFDLELELQSASIAAGAAKNRGDKDELAYLQALIRRLEGRPTKRDLDLWQDMSVLAAECAGVGLDTTGSLLSMAGAIVPAKIVNEYINQILSSPLPNKIPAR